MTAEEKIWIDNASAYQLLQKWRFSPIGSSYFQEKERADYFQKKMTEKRCADQDAWVRASKDLGWGNN
jgi:hypothetical protein